MTTTRTATGVALQSSSLIPSGGVWFAMIGLLPITKPQLQQSHTSHLCGYGRSLLTRPLREHDSANRPQAGGTLIVDGLVAQCVVLQKTLGGRINFGIPRRDQQLIDCCCVEGSCLRKLGVLCCRDTPCHASREKRQQNECLSPRDDHPILPLPFPHPHMRCLSLLGK